MILVNGKEVEFEKFPNGETKLIEESFPRSVVVKRISLKYQNDSDLIKLMLVKNYIDSVQSGCYGVRELLIYYMPYSRMDRSENNSAFTLKYVANFINQLGFRLVKIVEPHSDVTPALINNCQPMYVNFDLLPNVMREVNFNKENDYIMFPDSGAQKRYSKLKGYEQLVGYKKRDFKTGKIQSLEVIGGNSLYYKGNSKVIIVDDLSSYGGTFFYSATELKNMGFKEIYLLVAHAEDNIFEGKIFKTSLIDKVFTTNSIMTMNGVWTNKQYDNRLKVYDIEGVVE